jgi:hypothetical protein
MPVGERAVNLEDRRMKGYAALFIPDLVKS